MVQDEGGRRPQLRDAQERICCALGPILARPPMSVRRYRFATLLAGKVGEWRDTKRQALEDAVAADMAEFDDQAPAGVQLDAGVMIDECEAGQEPRSLSDWELWACASRALQEHGPEASKLVKERIWALAEKGDIAGVQTWRAIGHRLEQLLQTETLRS